MVTVAVPASLPIPAIDGVTILRYRELAELHGMRGLGLLVPPYMGPAEELSIMATLPDLDVLQLLTAGFEHALADAPAHITVCNAAGVHDASTAELALGLILASQRGIDHFARAMPDGRWEHQRFASLADRSVLVIGAGGLGQAIERRLLACEASVTMMARSARPGVRAISELDTVLAQMDIVILAVPLTPQTHHLVDAGFLRHMVRGALIVNMARGPVVDTEALTEAVRHGAVRAALDVTDPEPLPADHPLWRLPGVLISPHVGGNSSAFVPRAIALVEDQIRRWIDGEPLRNVVRSAAH